MADLSHSIGGDLALGASGDLAVVTDTAATSQAILHRLLTATGAYIWDQSYGAGLPAVVGSVVSGQQIAAMIRAQLQNEASVARIPLPDVAVSTSPNGTTIATITYVDANTNNSVTQDVALEQ